MATSIELANLALLELGRDRITSLDDGSEEANWISAIQDVVMRQCISTGPWDFAVKRAELSQLDTDPEFGYDYQYQLPTDFIKILEVNEESVGTYPHRIENNKLLIDNSSVQIKYVSNETDTGIWPPYFEEVYIKGLAYRLCYAFRADRGLRADLKNEYYMAIHDGLALDAQQGSHDIIQSNEFIEDR